MTRIAIYDCTLRDGMQGEGMSLSADEKLRVAHVLDEQAGHIAAVCAEAARRGVRVVEPTAAAEAAWVATIRERARDQHAFLAGCTPGYYNFEGRPRTRSEQFGGGPVEFHEILRDWRAGGMDDVLSGGDA